MNRDSLNKTINDICKECREPLMDAEHRDAYDRLPEGYKAEAEARIMDDRIEPIFYLLESLTNGADDELKATAVRLATRMHRTLIQSFTSKFVIPFLQELVKGSCDLRNEAAREFARKALEANGFKADENLRLPLI